MANKATPSRSKGKRSRDENRFDFSFSDDKKHEATSTTTMEQELSGGEERPLLTIFCCYKKKL